MQALVLVGGKGTRLKPLTEDKPKPVLTLVDRPFMRYMIEWLEGHGVDEIVFACGFLPDQLQEVLGNGSGGGAKLRYLVEPFPLGTGGAIRHAAPYLRETFFALNGDVLTDLDLTSLWNAHHGHGARLTLGLYPVEDPSNYGLVDLADDESVTAFHEKPDPGHVGSGLISAGTYVIEREVLDLMPEAENVSIEHEVFPALVNDGLYGHRLDGYWMDIGTPERYREASWDIIEGRVSTAVEQDPRGVHIARDAEVAEDAEIGPRAVIGRGCKVGSGAKIADSVLLDGCDVGAGASVSESILGPGSTVGDHAVVGNAVLGTNGSVDAR
jgi:mannose-1-phosphate guanylyltransferase